MRNYIRALKMKISQKQNIIYKDRMSHKLKNDVTVAGLSPKKHFNETPLKREVNDISFKGVFSLNGLKKSMALFNEKNYALDDSLKLLKKYIGKAPEVLNSDTANWSEMGKYIERTADGAVINIKEKNWTKQLFDAMGAPVTELPFRILKSIKNSIHGHSQPTKEAANFVQSKMNTIDNPDIVNSMIGYMESAQKYKHDSDKIRSAGLMENALKMFDSKAGNYNAVHERALTRIVTGFIPAYFLANDAYNLSRICDDDPQKAEKERKLRFNQETKRVMSNAYLQLITLGALSKWINKSKATFIGVTALTVLITEAFSRLSNGKKIHMISKEEAIAMNKKEGLLPADYDPNKKSVEVNAKPAFKGSQVFSGFGIVSDLPYIQPNSVTMTGKSVDEKLKAINESKPLLSFSTLAKWFVGTIALGFAFKKAQGVKLSNGLKIKDYMSVIAQKYDKGFNKLTTKDYKLSRAEYTKIIDKLKSYDETVANYFEKVIGNYQKTSKVQSISAEFANVLENNGLKKFAQAFKHLANSRKNSVLADIPSYNEAQKFLKARNEKVMTNNLKEFFELLKQDNKEDVANKVKDILFDKDGVLNTNNYNKAKKFINENAKEYGFTFDNRFKVDEAAENLKMFENAIEQLKTKNLQDAERYVKVVNDSVDAEVLSLGKSNRFIIKELADFCTEPFKFLWGTITLPYKHIAKPLSQALNPQVKLPKWPNEKDMVAKTISRITKKPFIKLPAVFGEHQGIAKIDYNNIDFSKYMNKQFNKGFNTATMSSLSNSDLSALAKNTSTAATIWFLMSDNHNMVMQKSNGEDKVKANTKAKERLVQETSRTFYNVMFINLFNNTFRSIYNSSLFGAQTVNMASTLIGEYVNRKAIGMPVSPQSREEILNKEYENITSEGPKGKFFRFMSRLTGKKVLSQRDNMQKK